VFTLKLQQQKKSSFTHPGVVLMPHALYCSSDHKGRFFFFFNPACTLLYNGRENGPTSSF